MSRSASAKRRAAEARAAEARAAEPETPAFVWNCCFGFPTCTSDKLHQVHGDVATFARSGTFKSGDFDTLTRLGGWHSVVEPLAARADLTSTQRVRLASLARTEPEWAAVTARADLHVLRALAGCAAPSADAARLLVEALNGDRTALVSQFFALRQRPNNRPRPEILAVLLEDEFTQVAHAIMALPCPSGRWTPGLVQATTRQLLKRLPADDRASTLEAFLLLAREWEGTLQDLVVVAGQL